VAGMKRIAMKKVDKHNLLLLVSTLIVGTFVSMIRPNIFLTWDNLNSMLLQISEVGLLTIGMMFAFLIDGIDLSIVSNAVLSATAGGYVILEISPGNTGLGIAVGIITAILLGTICGLINGYLVAKIKLPAILATLGTNSLYRGIAMGMTKGSTLSGFPEVFSKISNSTLAGIYNAFLIFLIVAIAAALYLNLTKEGFLAAMTGNNKKAAAYSGINIEKSIIHVHGMIGMIAGIAGIVMMSRSNSINPDYGTSYLLQTILVCVVAGVSISGGKAKLSGIVLALLLMQIISTSFNMLLTQYTGANFFKNFAWGALLLIIMILEYYQSNRRNKPVKRSEDQYE